MPYFIISTILFVAALIILYWIHNQYHLDIVVTPAKPPAADAPLISLCIPARNEERNIRNCVESALAQDYPNIEVIVLDDRSTDSTLTQLKEIASRDSRLLPISGSDLPEGWAGKPHALFQASAVARGEWLCFVDSDTFLNSDAISSCYAKALETKADLFTTLTQQVLGSFWEKVVMPLVMTALSVGFSPRKVNDPKRRDAIANGQFILIRRTVYDAIGGHEKVKDQIVEDKAISEQVKWNGYRLIVADGLQVIRTRMYTSLETMWEGWTKNIYLGLHDHPAMLLLGAFGATLALLVALFLPVWPMLGVAWYLQGGGWLAVGIVSEALIVWGVLLLARAQVARKMHISAWYAWTVPLGAGVFAAMMIASAWKVISGQGVTWRGRKYHPAK
ncbi:glycosyltransferase [Candidatus Villigracilis affinis]|uniref:glycosyltransferase n=1 Tax=Candidatus Villigracilis affinis TaxID=3140682 RepID=UPI001D9055B6|nr:glycosyltransferase [Anaerolineales bacterium]